MGFHLAHKHLFHLAVLIALLGFSVHSASVHAQSENNAGISENTEESRSGSDQNSDSLIISDTNNIYPNDTTETAKPDTLSKDTLPPKEKKAPFESKVEYQAEDSMILDMKLRKAFLYHKAEVHYESIILKAAYIEIDFDKSIVTAHGLEDTTGTVYGYPLFIDGGQEFQAEHMRYNFETQKGKIKKVVTQQDDGYIHGDDIKKFNKDVMFIKDGKYTTCNHLNPHFHIQASKLKLIDNDKIITGPAQLRIEDIPTPLVLPFGFFPNSEEQQNGILIPSYGYSPARGYFLQDGGYYWGISDHLATEIRGDIYTNLSYATRTTTQYNKRYVANGTVNIDYLNTRDGDPETPEFRKDKSFFIKWNHNQDPKASPTTDFRASVNAGTANFYENDFNTNMDALVQNDFSSNISFSKQFKNSPVPLNLTVGASHSQNSRDSTINITLPQATLNMSRIFPFERKNRVGSPKSYERIGISYTGDVQNRLRTREDELLSSNTFDKMLYGVRHSIPINWSFKTSHLTWTPNANITETWTFQSFRQSIDPEISGVIRDTVQEFNRFGSYNLGLDMATKIYGMYTFKEGNVKAIRHTMTPNFRMNYVPVFSRGDNPSHMRDIRNDTLGRRFNIYEGGVYQGPSNQERLVGTFDLQNNLEMKHKRRNDTTGELSKSPILEMLSLRTNYDFLADSLNMSQVDIQARTTLFNILNVRGDVALDPYALNEEGTAINTFRFRDDGKLFRVTRIAAAVGITLQGEKKENPDTDKGTPAQQRDIRENPHLYADFNVPWRLSIDYNFTYANQGRGIQRVNTLNFRGEVNLTEGWRTGFLSGLDVENMQVVPTTSFNIMRDLHCWQINLNVIPFGPRRSFNFLIQVKSPMLQDLQLQRRRSWFDQ